MGLAYHILGERLSKADVVALLNEVSDWEGILIRIS
jgi:hypothetical protein